MKSPFHPFHVLVLLPLLAAATPVKAQFGGSDALTGAAAPTSADQVVTVSLHAVTPQLVAGETFHLAVQYDVAEHWHVYWKNAGDAGMAPSFKVDAPKGFTVHPPRFPRPLAMKDITGDTFGYDGQAIIFIPITAPAALDDSSVTFAVETNFLVCKNVCLLGSQKKTITLSAATDQAAASPDARLLSALHALPGDLIKDANGTVELKGDTLTITLPADHHENAVFFPVHKPGVTLGEGKIFIDAETIRITVIVDINPKNALGEEMFIEGLVGLGNRSDDPAYEFSIPVPSQ